MRRLFSYICIGCFLLLSEGLRAQAVWHGIQRSLRYRPEGGDFVIVNGPHRFNRALYGTNTPFRVEGGDLPEFALYLPGMGGNWRFGLLLDGHNKWLIKAAEIKAIYRPGSLLYDIKDPLLGKGVLHIAMLALADGEGMIIRVSGEGIDPRVRLFCTFGGVSGKKFSRDGDIGADPESSFDCKPEYCKDDHYSITDNHFQVSYGGAGVLEGVLPSGSVLRLADAADQDSPDGLLRSVAAAAPVLTATLSLQGNEPLYFLVRKAVAGNTGLLSYTALTAVYEEAEKARKTLADRVLVNTPDPYINTLGGALSMAADGIWEDPSYMHGAIAWRMRLNGWRGPYVADPLGWHDRARRHFSGYAHSQITDTTIGPVVPDTVLHWARQKEQQGTALFSNGYICRYPDNNTRVNHYDMNLVYVDELLDHFYWTGDTAYIREMWPVLQRHLAWEKRSFDADGDGLYDAYCCIWASDALEYSGGGVTHSSAYNYRANRTMAELAGLIGQDPTPYQQEADKILRAINTKLWMPERGWYAEYIDRAVPVKAPGVGYYPPLLHPAAGLWTIYQAIDSQVPDAFQAWQSLRYIDRDIPHIPVLAAGLADTNLYTLATTNWEPYAWSLNNVVMAESLHTALAYWQGGQPDQAIRLWKGALIESMYLGACPGNFQQLSFYDAMRGELFRDFADPIGMAARSLVEGLFGIRPDALHDTLSIRPGWPLAWDHASLHVPDIELDYSRKGNTDLYTILPAFGGRMNLQLTVRSLPDATPVIRVNGLPAEWTAVADAIGVPLLQVTAAAAPSFQVEIDWQTKRVEEARILKVYDPQGVLDSQGLAGDSLRGIVPSGNGEKTCFVQLQQGAFTWWAPRYFHIVPPAERKAAIVRGRYDTISLSASFNDRVTQIFRNQYLSPRCSSPALQLPLQGIGNWCFPLVTADIDDEGLRKTAGEGSEIRLPKGIPFATPGHPAGNNIIFTSRWGNYPDSVTIPLKGKAAHAWMLMAGSTNPMQSRITNGIIEVYYKDGSRDSLALVNPDNWWPIEQDYYEDGYAFYTGRPRPWRVELKTGRISDQRGKWTSIKGFTDTAIEGGAATVLDMPLRPGRELDRIVLRTTAQEVVIGLMSLTLLRN